MKKFVLIILAVLLIFAVSCSQDKGIEEPTPSSGSAQMPVEKETGKDRLIEQGGAARAIDYTGISLKINVKDDGVEEKFWFGGKDGIYWIGCYDETAKDYDLVFYGENKIWDADESKWQTVPDLELKDVLFPMIDAILYQSYNPLFSLSLQAAGEETISGRACAKYKMEQTILTQTASITFWVDKEYGCTMKVEYKAAGVVNESSSFDLNGSKFSNLTADDLPAGYAAAKAAK